MRVRILPWRPFPVLPGMPNFDLQEGVRLRDAGMGLAANSDSGAAFLSKADELLRTIALNNEFLTADHLRQACHEAGVEYHRTTAGVAITNGSKHGYYRDTNRHTQTEVPTSHGRGLKIWESLIFTGRRMYGLSKSSQQQKWLLKLSGMPSMVFVERATALEWIPRYLLACGKNWKDVEQSRQVQVLPVMCTDLPEDPIPVEVPDLAP